MPNSLELWLTGLLLAGGALAQAADMSPEKCGAETLGASVPVASIGEPVSAVKLSKPVWTPASGGGAAYCSVDGSMAPIDKAAPPILFRLVMPEKWSNRAAHLGGGGMNGSIPANLTAQNMLTLGFATYGSDSGHQGGGRGPAPDGNVWSLNAEAIRNIGYMQLKKTHDAAMVLIERAYGTRPKFSYFIGTSQGGREALTVAQRYPADYNGVAANVPIVSFSTLMLAPELIRIHENPAANWVTTAKVNAIRGEFMRQCDSLDGLEDGVINNYQACRAIFDVTQGASGRKPWAAKRCPNNADPNPADTSAAACLTDGQISTLEMVYRRYKFAEPLANGVASFGMWLPNTDPSGSGLIVPARFRGQEGAGSDAPVHTSIGTLGVTGFLMRDLGANPLDYREGGPLNERRKELSAILDSTNPDLSAFRDRGGKLLVAIGTNDTLASPGAQLDYYQSVLDKMTRAKVDTFARFWVLPQTGHGLTGSTYGPTPAPIPSTWDRVNLLIDWVENAQAPGKSITVTGGGKSMPMCSYPEYPKYAAGAYTCAEK